MLPLRLIPLWRDIDEATIRLTDPGLLDIRAIVCKGRTIEEVAYNIIGVVRPDIFAHINRRQRERILDSESPIFEIDPKLVVSGPRIREKIPTRDLPGYS